MPGNGAQRKEQSRAEQRPTLTRRASGQGAALPHAGPAGNAADGGRACTVGEFLCLKGGGCLMLEVEPEPAEWPLAAGRPDRPAHCAQRT